jgi:hypothetical protein
MGRTLHQIGICLAFGALAGCSSNATGISSPDAGPDTAAGCPTTPGPIDGKITEADRTRFEATSGSTVVLIMVAGGAQSRPIPECPTQRTDPCPERDAVISQMEAENLASQQCVRELVAGVGGTADPTTFWIVNAFTATLTWDQIQVVAAHPHVISIESDNSGTPPP